MYPTLCQRVVQCIYVGCTVGVFSLTCQHKLSQELMRNGYKNNSPKSKHQHKIHSELLDGREGWGWGGGRYHVVWSRTPTVARRRHPD